MLNKVVLITGSSSGIGEAVALRFAQRGCRLVVHGTNAERLHQVAERCVAVSPNNSRPVEVIGDFREGRATSEKLIANTLKAYGQLDVLINNVGLFRPISVDDADAFDTYSEAMRLNVDSAVRLSLLSVPHLRKTEGNIVNVSSNLHAKCIKGGFAYCSAKAALSMFSKSLAVELAPTVRVNTVSPGPVATLMSTRCGMPVHDFKQMVGPACLTGRVGEPEEVARLIEFLASPESAFITGSDYIIDGGSTIKPEGKVMGQD